MQSHLLELLLFLLPSEPLLEDDELHSVDKETSAGPCEQDKRCSTSSCTASACTKAAAVCCAFNSVQPPTP